MAAGPHAAPEPQQLARLPPSAVTAMNAALADAVEAGSGDFNLGSILLILSLLFCLATPFFGTRGGYYDSDDYDGNGTAH